MENNNYEKENDMVNQEKIDNEEFKQFCINHNNSLSQKTIKYTDFLYFLLEQSNWNNQIVIMKEESYYKNEDELNEGDIIMCSTYKFYDKFGQDMWEFERNFISAKYIDDLENTMKIIVKANGENERFIIDAV